MPLQVQPSVQGEVLGWNFSSLLDQKPHGVGRHCIDLKGSS
jgi:hypothetical protein